MDMGKWPWRMGIHMRVNGKWGRCMELEATYGKMERSMKEGMWRDKEVGKVLITLKMGRDLKGYGRKAWEMEMERSWKDMMKWKEPGKMTWKLRKERVDFVVFYFFIFKKYFKDISDGYWDFMGLEIIARSSSLSSLSSWSNVGSKISWFGFGKLLCADFPVMVLVKEFIHYSGIGKMLWNRVISDSIFSPCDCLIMIKVINS